MVSEDTGHIIEAYRPLLPDSYLTDEKFDLILLLAGEKRGVEWQLFSESGRSEQLVNPIDSLRIVQLETFLTLLGVLFSPLGPAIIQVSDAPPTFVERIVYRLAINPENLLLMEKLWSDPKGYPKDGVLHGELSGFPRTAIKAFAQGGGATLTFGSLPPDVVATEAYAFVKFNMSRSHWRDELAVGERWARIIKAASPFVYAQRRDDIKRYLSNIRD